MIKKTIYGLIIYIFIINKLSANIFNIDINLKKYRAEQAFKDGNLKKSITIFRKIKNKDMSVLYNLGNLFYKLKRYHKSLFYYKKALIFNIKKDELLHNIGNVYFKQKKFKDAFIAYSDSLKIKKNMNTKYNYKLAKALKNYKKEDNFFKINNKKQLNNPKNISLKNLNKFLQTNIGNSGNSSKNREMNRLLSKLNHKRPIVKYSMKSKKENNIYANPW